jgi:hypothetical protein
MTHGMAIFSASGQVTYSTTDVTWNQVDMLLCRGGEITTGRYPVLEGKEVLTAQVMVNPPPIDRKAIAHTIRVTGTDVVVSDGSEDTYVLVLMR